MEIKVIFDLYNNNIYLLRFSLKEIEVNQLYE